MPGAAALLSPPFSFSVTHPPVERGQRGTVPRLQSGKFPGSLWQGIKAREKKRAAPPAPAPSPPPAPAMNPHLRLLLLLLAAAALCQGKRLSWGYPSVRGRASAGVREGPGGFGGAQSRGSEGSSRLPGAPLAGELRCRCVRTVSEVIPPRRLVRLEFLAEGPHCAVPEVM